MKRERNKSQTIDHDNFGSDSKYASISLKNRHRKIDPHLNNNDTVKWLKKRFSHKSKIQYLNRPSELKQQIDF